MSGYAIDPELADALDTLPRGANGSLLDLTDIPEQRATMTAAARQLNDAEPDPRVHVTTEVVIRLDGSPLDIVMFRPADATAPMPGLLWFHAGGQVFGSAREDAAFHAQLAQSVGCVVAAVDYRLAPETPAPGAAEDGFLAFTHLQQHAHRLQLDPQRIGLAGASGGGAPATATALMARDQHVVPPRMLSLSCPMLDDRNITPSSRQVTDIGIWDRRDNLLAWKAVLGERMGQPDIDPYSVPGRAADLHAMPPTFIACAQYDVFRDEDIDFARRLIVADVPVELHLYAGAFHSFDRFAPQSSLADSYQRTWHTYLRRKLHTTPT